MLNVIFVPLPRSNDRRLVVVTLDGTLVPGQELTTSRLRANMGIPSPEVTGALAHLDTVHANPPAGHNKELHYLLYSEPTDLPSRYPEIIESITLALSEEATFWSARYVDELFEGTVVIEEQLAIAASSG